MQTRLSRCSILRLKRWSLPHPLPAAAAQVGRHSPSSNHPTRPHQRGAATESRRHQGCSAPWDPIGGQTRQRHREDYGDGTPQLANLAQPPPACNRPGRHRTANSMSRLLEHLEQHPRRRCGSVRFRAHPAEPATHLILHCRWCRPPDSHPEAPLPPLLPASAEDDPAQGMLHHPEDRMQARRQLGEEAPCAAHRERNRRLRMHL
mmetsp:Transcript_60174/g.186237  ORF Transcript_60174/g.186237 Transcript_60174/m.186237 type:complete len:205 (-) Transcript_60174:307-921(-)